MPSAVREMVIDGPRLLGLKPPACFGTENLVPPCFNGSPPRDTFNSFYHTKRVGNYLIGRKLGEGSFAKVREGLHAMTGEKVAVKVIDKRKAKKDSYVTKNLRREGQIQQMIRHPNITQLLDILETENSYYLVLELCPGGNLMNHIYEKKRLEEGEAQKYVRQLVIAVEHLHRAGVVHRDLKIENLLLDENDNIKLIDFGLSNCAGILGYSDPFSTQCGSPAYAAPELLSRKKYGSKVDVWSVGVNMYAMLTGMLPFTVEPFSLRSLHEKMVNKEMNPLPPHLSSAAVSLLQKLLEPDPVKRPNIHQVMSDPWLQQGQPQSGSTTYLNRIHIDEINHVVVLHMTEKMGFRYSEVLNTVLANRASHILAVYFLLNKKMERVYRVYENNLSLEKEKNEQPQPRWPKQAERLTIPPKQTPLYLAVSKNPGKDKKQKTGLFHSANSSRDSQLGPGGSVASSSLEYLEIQPLFPRTPQPIRRLEIQALESVGPGLGGLEVPTSSVAMAHSWDSGIQELGHTQTPPWHRLTSSPLGPFPPPQNACLKKATIPCPPAVIRTLEHRNPAMQDWGCLDSISGQPSSAIQHGSPQHRGRFPTMGIGQILKRNSPPLNYRLEARLEPQPSIALSPYHMQTLLCASGALKTLC
ncbi:hormonally up-regulated neu tumor-associated kinase homolog A-like [Megalops cyprinoides]|uniref:hormonally up-regulated neu tumor-associated kinase homolog A-like n=1 Tax=Megalops cyprinoides TaxID=118141 RepID=UPI001864ED19|nr:hormonally up-regulated neu tumor-associated kinase homolog A-like [Megalops cyprinoides]